MMLVVALGFLRQVFYASKKMPVECNWCSDTVLHYNSLDQDSTTFLSQLSGCF